MPAGSLRSSTASDSRARRARATTSWKPTTPARFDDRIARLGIHRRWCLTGGIANDWTRHERPAALPRVSGQLVLELPAHHADGWREGGVPAPRAPDVRRADATRVVVRAARPQRRAPAEHGIARAD